MDTNQCPTNLGLSFGGLNCLVVFPTHFNPSNSLLILLQISLLFMCTPVLSMTWLEGCLRNMIAKLMPIRGDSRVRHKRQQQKTVTTQPLVTNKLNRRNMYRRGDNTFDDMQHYSDFSIHRFSGRKLRSFSASTQT